MTQVLEKHRQQPQQDESQIQSGLSIPACHGKTELFFSEKTIDMRLAQIICSTCPMRVNCLEEARINPPFAGVWGGFVFDNGEEQLFKRGRGRPRKSEQLDNARVQRALENKDSSDTKQDGNAGEVQVRRIA